MTPLARRLAEEIRRSGPIGVDTYMAAALGDPEHGYYRTRDPLGAAGDFTTAPEISQVFGEIVGLWCADQWQRMGSPAEFSLVELGPGRGTLIADLLRAVKVVPACRAAARVHLVETSPPLKARQHRTLAGQHPDILPAWHESLAGVPEGPLLLVANEFFDALPIRQWVRERRLWRERRIGLDPSGAFVFVTGPVGTPDPVPDQAPDGSIFETNAAAREIAREIGGRLGRSPGAALLIDYGHPATAVGETLQAVHAHRPVDPLARPGEADLTAHVDFAALAAALAGSGAAVWGPVDQGRFLIENGVVLREQALVRGRDADAATAIRHAIRRLLDPSGMGRLFKVMAATSPGLPCPPGF